MDIFSLIEFARKLDGSDIHLAVGLPVVVRVFGELRKVSEETVTQEYMNHVIDVLLRPELKKRLEDVGDVDAAWQDESGRRYRINIFRQRGSYGAAIRLIKEAIPSIDSLGLPEVIKELVDQKRGLILVTGPTGSGKSTTLAAMVDRINRERSCHILTIEEPIEYLHKHVRSIINQREIGSDTPSYLGALRAALREDPDVILVGEMRDLETISMVLTAAETGHLVMSTLHTVGAVKTIDRIIDVFPPYQQQQIRMQLSTVLQGVISQQLLPRADGMGRIAAFEIMRITPAIANLIREGKTHQIASVLQTGASYGMVTMDSYLAGLYKRKEITWETALSFAVDRENLMRIAR